MKQSVCSRGADTRDNNIEDLDLDVAIELEEHEDRESIHGGAFRDLSGRRFGRWTVIDWLRTDAHGSIYRCICDCGVEREVRGYALINGKSRSCGTSGCRMKAPVIGSKMPTSLLVAPEDMQAYRIWCDLVEIANPLNWRCQEDGSPYPILGISRDVKDWPTFHKWMNGEVIDPTEGSKRNLTDKQAYYTGMVLVSRADAPVGHSPEGVTGVVIRFENLEWGYGPMAKREGRTLVLGTSKSKYYRPRGEEDGPVYTRKQLVEKFGVTMSTFNARISRGWTVEEACVGKRTISIGAPVFR